MTNPVFRKKTEQEKSTKRSAKVRHGLHGRRQHAPLREPVAEPEVGEHVRYRGLGVTTADSRASIFPKVELVALGRFWR